MSMKMKKVLALLMTAAMIFAFAACGSSSSSGNGSADSDSLTLKEGTLKVAMEIGYPPMEYFDKDGTTPIGFDVEMSKAIADYLGLEVEYVDVAWDGIFSGLDSDKYDIVCSSCSITPERQKNFLMTEPYVQNRIELLVPKGSDITGLDTVAGKSIAVQAETTCDIYLKDHDTGCDVMQYDKIINCFFVRIRNCHTITIYGYKFFKSTKLIDTIIDQDMPYIVFIKVTIYINFCNIVILI